MAVVVPAYSTLKTNLVNILKAVSTADSITDASRAFDVYSDRWRPWLQDEQEKALVNVVVSDARLEPGSGQKYHAYRFTVNFDLYVLGGHEEQTDADTDVVTTIEADKKAAERLDLLVAQVQYGITRLSQYDFGFAPGLVVKTPPSLQLYDQEGEQETGNYATARWSMEVILPFYPADDGTTVAITELNIAFKDALESMGIKYTYGT